VTSIYNKIKAENTWPTKWGHCTTDSHQVIPLQAMKKLPFKLDSYATQKGRLLIRVVNADGQIIHYISVII